MKKFLIFEDFRKSVGEKISPEEFKTIKVGSTVKYYGFPYEVIENDGFALQLKDKEGKLFLVNLKMFNDKGSL